MAVSTPAAGHEGTQKADSPESLEGPWLRCTVLINSPSLLLSFPQNQPWWSPSTFWFNLLVLLRNLLTVTNGINLPRAKQRCFQRFWHRLGDQKLRPALQGCISNLIAEGNVGYLTLPLNWLSVNAGSWTAPHLPVETSKRRGAANWASPSLALPEPPCPAISRGCLGDF